MAIDRRKSAAARFEDDRKKKAAAAAKKAEQEKKAAAKKSQKQNKPVRSPGKDITTSVRDTFRQQAAKPQFGTKQTAAQRMQGRSENWARLEAQKANADKSTRKKIEAEQDRLHKANRKDAKGMTFDSATGRWMGGGKPAYTPNVLPGMSRDAQRTGTERSLRNGIVAPDMQKAAKKHRDAVWDRVHGPETGERIKKMLSGAAKGYGSDMENFHGLAITGRGLGMEKEHAREIKVWEDEIRRWEKSLRDWEADGSLTNDERKELTDLIAANRKKIEMYEKQNRGTRAASQEVYQTADALGESGARDTQTAKRGLGAFGSAAIDVGTAGAQMLGDMALGGTPAMLMRGIGGGAKEARQSGASHMQQANYGMLSGAASVLTEKISNVAKPLGKAFGKGAADDLIQKGIDKAVKKLAGSAAGEKALQTIAKHGANALGEGFEESLEAALDPLLKRATYDSGAQWDLGEIIYNGIIGAGTGLVAGSGMEAAQDGIESAARGVRDRMGQPLPLPRAKPKGQETGTPRQDVNSPEMDAMQSAWQETDSMLGSDSMRRYMTQVDLTFQGNMREGMYLRLGDTPQILRKFGAKSDNVVMTQDTARKIAYPSGYLGVKHGHNLGIPALKQLPMQVANPEAVLRSKSQPNSLVLLTKWIDKDGAPVIIALHLDKRGQLTIDNQVASAYGKRNLDALVGENGENILWTKKEDTLYPQSTGLQLPETSGDGVPSTHSISQADAKNKSIDQLLSNGRPMPEAMADDTLVAHSIAQTAGESKAGLTMEYGKPKTENSQAIGQTEKPGLTIAYGKPQAEETAIDTNPETHTPEQTSIEKPKTLNDRIKENRDLFEKNGTLFEMTGNEFAQSDKKLIDQVTEFFNSIGNKVFRKNFGEVTLTRSGARDSISHGIGREKAIAFAAVPDVIEKGQVIDEQANWKGRRYDTVTFGGRIKIAGQDYDMGVIVKRYDNPAMASKYYVHEVMLANKEGEATTFKTGTEPAEPVGYPSDVTSPSTDSIPQTAGESKAKLTMEYGKPQAEVPDPGILKQGDGWQAGEVKPRLGGEHEVRPENVQKIILEENPEMMQALGETQGRAQEELIKLYGQQMPKIAIGDKVRARGLRNLGTIIGLNADGTYEVEFHNKQTGANKVVTMPAEAFETIRRKKLPPDAKSVQRAQEQQEALESDSYEIPDIVEQEERAVRAAQNAEDAKDQLEALEGPRTDAADAAYERTRATYADMVAEEALLRANRIAANHPVREAAARSSMHPMDVNAPDAAGAIEITRQLEGMRQTLGRLQHQFKLTKADLVTAEELAKGRTPTREVSPEKLEKITSYAKLLGEYKTAMQPFYEYKIQLDTSRKNAADALIRNSENWKDAKMGVSLSAKTPERVIEAVTGNDAAEVNDALIRPVHAHNAERMRYENDHRDMLREAVKGTTKEESTWVAMLNYAEYLERTGKDSSKLRVAMDKYYEKNKKHIRPARAKQLERDLIAIMDSLYPDQNETRIRNGYEPLEYLKNYLPARTRIDEGGRVAKFLRKALGIETKADELPTEIAGTTANRRPGQPYQPYAEHRVGDTDKVQIKDFDAVRAVDDYISFAGREIFFTEDIQNIRTFEERLRYRFSDEGTRAELDSLDGDYTMDPDERLKAKMEIWERDQYSLPHFPTWLRKYADMLAGKKQLTDRSAEEQTGRPMYRAVSDVETKAAVNLTGFNIATALNNLVAMQQGGSEVSAKSMARAALNYARSLGEDGDFDARSTFLTNRHGTDRVWKTKLQKVQDIGGKPMEWVDHFTAGILTRGRYYDNVRDGLSAEQAMKEADDWAARVIGDRSVGARPMLFESKNPLVKAVTMFQLEPANTISHWVHDIPRSMSVGAAVGTFAKLFLTAYLFNDTMEKITGVRPAPDPVGLINSMVGRFTGWMLPNTIDMALELVRGDLDEEDFQTEKPELGDAILETAQDVASEVPFISGPLGAAFGAGNARMPIESAMPDLVTLTKTLTGEGTRESKIVTAADELSKPLITIGLPTGGGQLRKTVRGLNAAYNSGVYGYDKEGKRELKFPLYGEGNKALRAAQAAVFGPYATGRGREYVRSGFQSSLNAKETRAYDTLRNQFGVEPSAAYDSVRAVQAVDEMSTYERGGTKKGAKRNAIMALDLSPDAKKYLDGCLIGTSYDIPSYENETDFAITRSVTGKMQEAALSLAHEDGLSADAVIKYVLLCKTSSSENEIENKAGQMVDICTDLIGAEDLTDAQRRAVTEKLLIPQMGDKWNGEAAKTWLSGMDPTDIVYTKFRMDQIDAEVDDDAAIRKLDKADHKRAKKDALIDELGLDFKAEQGLRYFLGDAKGWDWEWSDIGRDGSEDERELAWELEQTGMDVVTYEIIKAGVGRQKGVEGERYSKKKKVIAYLNQWDLPQNQKDLILKMASTYDDYKIGRGGSGKSSGRKSTGMQQPQRLKTLKPFSLPF